MSTVRTSLALRSSIDKLAFDFDQPIASKPESNTKAKPETIPTADDAPATDEHGAWLPIPEFPGYEVSSRGFVRSLPKHCRPSTKILSKHLDSDGYPRVAVWRDGRQHCINTHILVMAAFVGPRPEGLVINHIDGDKTNNSVENLEYCTNLQNIRHARISGLTPYAANAKLSRADVLAIRDLYGVEQQKITAARYGITQSAVSAIQRRIVWKEVA